MIFGRRSELEQLAAILENGHNHVVLIGGYAGMGKTTLVRMYVEKFKERYANIYMWHPWDLPEDVRVPNKSLVIIDEADSLEQIKMKEVEACNKASSIIIVGRNVQQRFSGEGYTFFMVNALNQSDMLFAIKNYRNIRFDLDDQSIEKVVKASQGNPAILGLLLNSAEKLGVDVVHRLIYENIPIGKYDIVLPNRTIETPTIINIKNDVSKINDGLMRYIAENPQSMHGLSSREFEEVMAELFKKMGYDVELTKETRDGGKDIYIAQKTDIGKFLFLVECKHYSPDRPVGIDVIRNLYGVLGMEKKKPTGGIIATTSHFARGVEEQIVELNLEHRISLQDFEYISNLLKKTYLK